VKQRSALLPIFLIVLIDVMGFTIVIPLLALYAQKFGAAPVVATALVSVYAVCSLISTPIIGRLSDQYGRKRLLMISQAGTCAGFVMLGYASSLYKVWELAQLLRERGVDVKFAIHPVAGRMPGHMNVLLAEAGVPYDIIYDENEINSEFPTADVALIIGANDVVNPVARSDPSSPIYGMPILNADKARNVIVIKRGQGAGFSGIENALFFLDNTRMLYGDGQAMAAELISTVKSL
jgi:hypothetical protein